MSDYIILDNLLVILLDRNNARIEKNINFFEWFFYMCIQPVGNSKQHFANNHLEGVLRMPGYTETERQHCEMQQHFQKLHCKHNK